MSKLALFGGPKAVTLDYNKAGNVPIINDKARENVNSLLDKDEISMSPIIEKFEHRFADYIGARYAVTANNGTAALEAAMFAVGIKPGDEVLVPSYTYWASAVSIVAARGIPVFCEVDKDTYNFDLEDARKKLTSRTRAIMVVHVWGNPCDMKAIMAFAKENNLKVVEDCSHAHGASLDGKKVGILGDVGCFSMQSSKLLPAGEGGILVTNDRDICERSVSIGHYDRVPKLPEDSPYRKYALTGMGYKYRPHPLGIAIADAMLDTLDERNAMRNKNGMALEEHLSDLAFIKPQKMYEKAVRQYSYHYVYFDNSRLGGISTYTLLKALSAEGVICGYCGYGRLHQAPFFKEGGTYGDCGKQTEEIKLPVTEELGKQTFMIAPRLEKPCDELIEQYSAAYHKIAANVDALIEYNRENDPDEALKKVTGYSIDIVK
jgi:dTDP-4-amino-4,6-dideoxygalactose transaminase